MQEIASERVMSQRGHMQVFNVKSMLSFIQEGNVRPIGEVGYSIWKWGSFVRGGFDSDAKPPNK